MTDVALRVASYVFLHGTVVLGVAWLVVRYGPDRPAATTHATWVAAFAVLLLLPLGAAAVPGWTWTLAVDPTAPPGAYEGTAPQPGSGPTSPTGAPIAASLDDGGSAGPTAARSGRAAPTESLRWTTLYHWGVRGLAPGFLVIWGGGALLLLGRLGVGLQTLWRWRRSATALERSALPAALARSLDVRRPVSVRQSPAVRTPVVWGLAAPVVLLPSEATDWSRPRLRSVLLHELAHVKRGDALTHLLSRGARALFWPNPLAWTAVAAATAARLAGSPAAAGSTEGDGDSPGAVEYLRLFRDPRFAAFVLVTVAFSFAYNGTVAFLPLYLSEAAALSTTTASLLYSALFAVTFVQLVSGDLSDRLGRFPVMAAALVLATTALVGLVAIPGAGAVPLGALVVALGLGSHGFRPVRGAYLVEALPERLAGGGLGVVRTLLMGGGALAPSAVGIVADALGFRPAFALLAGSMGLAAAVAAGLWVTE